MSREQNEINDLRVAVALEAALEQRIRAARHAAFQLSWNPATYVDKCNALMKILNLLDLVLYELGGIDYAPRPLKERRCQVSTTYYCEACARDVRLAGHWDDDCVVMDDTKTYDDEGYAYACEGCDKYTLAQRWEDYDGMVEAALPNWYTLVNRPSEPRPVKPVKGGGK